jgi:hypothetical protein
MGSSLTADLPKDRPDIKPRSSACLMEPWLRVDDNGIVGWCDFLIPLLVAVSSASTALDDLGGGWLALS